LFATFQLRQSLLAVYKEKTGEDIKTIGSIFPFCFQGVMGVNIREKHLAGAVRDHQWPIKGIQKASHQLKNLLAD
jgi:hypothetical protein